MAHIESKLLGRSAICRSLLGAAALAAAIALAGCEEPSSDTADAQNTVPDWSRDIVWYQIFPERFRNGDPSNDPIRTSLEFPDEAPDSWSPTPWTADWYSRAEWEKEMGADFYERGVFHRRLGGDLQGVIDKLDYLADLGITGIYFNPVFYARSLHKYDGNSFHHVEPYFGPDPEGDLAAMEKETSDPSTWQWTSADKLFLQLIEEAHARGIRIVIDGVFNHSGRDFFAFEDLVANQASSPYVDWYIVEDFDNPDTPENEFRYKGWWGVETLPEFADNAAGDDLHPGPKTYVLDASLRWMDPDGDGDPSEGIDGWRLDVAEEVPIQFWADWNQALREVNPDVYTITEIWHDASTFLSQGGFSATMNYFGFALPTKAFLIDGVLSPNEFGDLLTGRLELYDESYHHSLQNCMESHDTDRLASMIVNRTTDYKNPERFDYDEWGTNSPRHSDSYKVRAPNTLERERLRLVVLFQYTFVGAPMLYYGTEAGMWGADDPDDRKPMVWGDLDYEDEETDPRGLERLPDPVSFDVELHEFYRDLGSLRREYESLRRGAFDVHESDDSNDSFSFIRSTETESLWILLNPSSEDALFTIPTGMVPRPVFHANQEPVMMLGVGRPSIKLAPNSGAIIDLEGNPR